MPNDELLPIKVVFAAKDDYRKPDAGGGIKIFGDVTNQVRSTLARQVKGVKQQFARAFSATPKVPAVAKVVLKSEATAKSHRPTEILNESHCPIIGGNHLGELYVSVHPDTLDLLERQILQGNTKQIEANISTFQQIQPYGVEDVLTSESLDQLTSKITANPDYPLRFRLFHHKSTVANQSVVSAFQQLARNAGAQEIVSVKYAEGLDVFRLRGVSPSAVPSLLQFVGTQNLSSFPEYRIVRTASRVLGNLSPSAFPLPESGRRYAVVGLIDSGTDPNNPFLQAWVEDRYDFVPRSMQNHDHGSFVAGLLIHGRKLNHNDARFPSDSSRIVDVVALDKDGEISEFDLINVIDLSLARYPHVKVWNLSLGLSSPCPDHEFSLLGAALDERAKRHGVLFVIAAGNYVASTFRSWPPQPDIMEQDRISPPGDAIHAITVGSVAHIDSANTCVRKEQPSPFSRRGPGPGYTMKPELCHYGGNCDADGNYLQTGVVSLDAGNHIAENIGTSFACPLVATVAANVHQQLSVDPDAAQPSLVKALLVHSAFLKQVPTNTDEINYFGIGRPLDAAQIVSCRQSSATVIFQIPLYERFEFGKKPFPIPSCLTDAAGLKAEVFMTLAYEPPVNRAYGIEYCRCNVTASLGTHVSDSEGKSPYTREIHPVPKSITKGYEKDLIKHGYKWCPIKLYYRKFKNGPKDKDWRLTLELLTRSEFHLNDKQFVTLIVTLRDPEMKAPVYNELVREMNRLNWQVQNLDVQARHRVQS